MEKYTHRRAALTTALTLANQLAGECKPRRAALSENDVIEAFSTATKLWRRKSTKDAGSVVVRVYGEFFPNSYRGARTTRLDVERTAAGWRVIVTVVSANRSRGEGPLTIVRMGGRAGTCKGRVV